MREGGKDNLGFDVIRSFGNSPGQGDILKHDYRIRNTFILDCPRITTEINPILLSELAKT